MPVDLIFEAFGMKRTETGPGKAVDKRASHGKPEAEYRLSMNIGQTYRYHGEVVKCRFDAVTGLSFVTDPPSRRAGKVSPEAAKASAEAFNAVVVGKHVLQVEPVALKWLHNYTDDEIHTFVVPKRTLARRVAARELLSVEETDKAVRLGRIDRLAAGVFGDPAKAHRWLRKPKRSLEGETPLAYLATEAGARAVEEMLNQIDHGILA